VVGTVIDPDMKDELRVTVVATGLGAAATKASLQVVDTAPRAEAIAVDDEPDYKEFDRPPAMRRSRGAATGQALATDAGAEEYFDIPAFLRRQAD